MPLSELAKHLRQIPHLIMARQKIACPFPRVNGCHLLLSGEIDAFYFITTLLVKAKCLITPHERFLTEGNV